MKIGAKNVNYKNLKATFESAAKFFKKNPHKDVFRPFGKTDNVDKKFKNVFDIYFKNDEYDGIVKYVVKKDGTVFKGTNAKYSPDELTGVRVDGAHGSLFSSVEAGCSERLTNIYRQKVYNDGARTMLDTKELYYCTEKMKDGKITKRILGVGDSERVGNKQDLKVYKKLRDLILGKIEFESLKF